MTASYTTICYKNMSEHIENEFLHCDDVDIELEEIRLSEYREKRIDGVFKQWVALQNDPVFIQYIFSSNDDIIEELNIKINKYIAEKKITEELSNRRLLIEEQNDAYQKSIESDIRKQKIREELSKKGLLINKKNDINQKSIESNIEEQKTIPHPTLEQLRLARINHFLKQ